MCGKPKVVQQDPEGDARRAAEKAAAEANVKKSMRRGGIGSSSTATALMPKDEQGGSVWQKMGDKNEILGRLTGKSKLGGG